MIRRILVMGSQWEFERIKKQYGKDDVQRFEEFYEVMEFLHKYGDTVDEVFFTHPVRYIELEYIKYMIELAHPKIKVHLN